MSSFSPILTVDCGYMINFCGNFLPSQEPKKKNSLFIFQAQNHFLKISFIPSFQSKRVSRSQIYFVLLNAK